MRLGPPPGWKSRRASRRVLVLPAVLLALLVAMPWLLKWIEARLPAAFGHFSEVVNSLITVLLAVWILDMIHREQQSTQRHLDQLEQLSLTDPLTGLGNRRAFERDLEVGLQRAERHAMPLALLYLDVDGLKRINDRFGHAVGDETLRTLAAVLRSTTRLGSDAAFRVGGDEFVMVLSAEAPAAELIASRVADSFLERSPLHTRVTSGVVVWDRAARIQQLIEEADIRMYRKKSAGLTPGARLETSR